ncbi:MAG: ABC transporter permease subunit [Gammaproteobacteria bacterium]|nr:ABC transporter permease subunit [Gammaproteobacteria bacterium]
MLWKVALFEFRYQLRQPAFWVIFGIFFLMAFGAMSSENISIGGGGAENFNSPYRIMQTLLVMSIFGIFIVTAFVSNIVLRDFDTKSAEIIFSTRIKKHQYLLGRFIGAFAVAYLAYSSVAWGSMFGSIMPWLDVERVGPLRPQDYFFSLTVLAFPSLLFTAGLFLALSAITRNLMLTYAGVVSYLVLYIVASNMLSDPELLTVASLLDPFGFSSFAEATRYWTVSERNTMLLPVEGLFLYNKLIWLTAGLAMLALTHRVFRFDVAGKTARKRWWHRFRRGSKVKPISVPSKKPTATPVFNNGTRLAQFRTRMMFEARSVVKSIPFVVILVLAVANTLGAMVNQGAMYGTDLLPVTRAMINAINGSFTFMILMIIVYYSAELVWRERKTGNHEIIDATPAPSWVFVTSKLLAMFIIVLAMFLVSIITAIIVQAATGYSDFEIGLYMQRLLFYQSLNLFLVSVLAVFVQVLSNNKYFGMLLMVLYIISLFVLDNIGLEHDLYQYAGRPAAPLSDMNASGHFIKAGLWLNLYWGFFALILAVMAYLMWNRGTIVGARHRLSQIRVASSPASVGIILVALGGFVATGSWIYYNTNVLNTYVTEESGEQHQIEYEERFRQYEFKPRPRIVEVSTEVDIYPQERRYDMRGSYVLENRTDEPLTEIQVVFNPLAEIHELNLQDASVAWQDEDHNYTTFALKEAMAPGEQLKLDFTTSIENPGFRNRNNDSSVVFNGTFFNNTEATPGIGFTRALLLSDRQERREHGLEPVDRMPKLEDERARRDSYLRPDSDWIKFETVVSTVPGQIVIAPGYLEKEWQEDDRLYFHYKMDAPIQNFFSYLSADYTVKKDKWNDVDIAVYYHDPHSYNVDRMITGVKDSLEYFSREFSPYQYRQLRILEFPAYAAFAQSFPNTIPYSESIGFVADIDEEDVDYVFYVTAHEVAHQWWAHQVMGANTQGGTVVVETLAQYSALMVMEQKYGPQVMRRFLQYELDNYLRNRGSERIAEMPLMRVENQGYIHYRKGSLVMYALKDYLGEDAVNRALRKLIDNHAYQYTPYTTSVDLIRYLREEATTQEQQDLITDLFERIVLFDLKVDETTVSETTDGQYEVEIKVTARKFEADGDGQETELPIALSIDVGAFNKNPDEAKPGEEPEIYLEKHRIDQAETTIRLTLDERPTHVGIDPYNKLVDRNSDDNVKSTP